MIAQWTAERTPTEAMRLLQDAGVTAAVVMNERDIFDDPHIRERGFLVEITHPEAGTHLYPGHQWGSPTTPMPADVPVPTLGQDNEYVYKRVLGYSEDEYDRLVREAHIGTDYLSSVVSRDT